MRKLREKQALFILENERPGRLEHGVEERESGMTQKERDRQRN